MGFARLRVEGLERGHRHDARGNILTFEERARLDGAADLGAARRDHQLWRAAGRLHQHISAAREGRRIERLRAREQRHLLAREDERRRPGRAAERRRPRERRLVAVGRAPRREVRDQTQRCDVLDRLVGRPVFPKKNRIVGEDIDGMEAHQRREANRGAHVIGELEEGRAVGDERAVARHPIHHRAHAVLADPEVEVAPLEPALRDRRRRVDLGLGRGSEIGRAAGERGDQLGCFL